MKLIGKQNNHHSNLLKKKNKNQNNHSSFKIINGGRQSFNKITKTKTKTRLKISKEDLNNGIAATTKKPSSSTLIQQCIKRNRKGIQKLFLSIIFNKMKSVICNQKK